MPKLSETELDAILGSPRTLGPADLKRYWVERANHHLITLPKSAKYRSEIYWQLAGRIFERIQALNRAKGRPVTAKWDAFRTEANGHHIFIGHARHMLIVAPDARVYVARLSLIGGQRFDERKTVPPYDSSLEPECFEYYHEVTDQYRATILDEQ